MSRRPLPATFNPSLLSILLTVALPLTASAVERRCALVFTGHMRAAESPTDATASDRRNDVIGTEHRTELTQVITPKFETLSEIPVYDWTAPRLKDSLKRLEPEESQHILTTLMKEIFGEAGEALRREKSNHQYDRGDGYATGDKITGGFLPTRSWMGEGNWERTPEARRSREKTQIATTQDAYVVLREITREAVYDGHRFVGDEGPLYWMKEWPGAKVRRIFEIPSLPFVPGTKREPLQKFWEWVEAHPERLLYAKLLIARSLDYFETPMTLEQGLELFDPAPRTKTRMERLKTWYTRRKTNAQPSLTELAKAENKIAEIEKIVVRATDFAKALEAMPIATVKPYQHEAVKLRSEVALLNINEVDLFGESVLMTASAFESDVHALAPRMMHANILTVTTLKNQSAAFVRLRDKMIEIASRLGSREALIPGAPFNPVRESKGLIDLRLEMNDAFADLRDIEGQTESSLAALLKFERVVLPDPHLANLIDPAAVQSALQALTHIKQTNAALRAEMLTLIAQSQSSILKTTSDEGTHP